MEITEMATRKVLVLDRHGRFAEDVARAAADLEERPEVLRLGRPTEVVDAVERTTPDVIVAGPAEVSHAGLRRLAQVHRANPRLVILLSPNGKPISVRESAACGASDVLPYPSTPSRMRIKIRRALETAEELRAERVVVERAPTPEPQRPVSTTTREGHVLTITSASGGCGKTFYATNVAAYLAKATGGRVVLVDLDLQFGEVSVSLQLKSERTIGELAEEDDVDTAFDDYVVPHDAGYDVLCAPKDPIAAERVGAPETTAILEAARRRYDHVVVDTPPSLNEVVLAAFDQSGSLVVMATQDIPSLRNLRVFLQTLDKLDLPADDVSIVVNKAEEGTGIDLAQVERVYPQGFSSVLPYSREVTRSINRGEPVIVGDPGAEISRRFVAGAKQLFPPTTDAELPSTDGGAGEEVGFFKRILKGVWR